MRKSVIAAVAFAVIACAPQRDQQQPATVSSQGQLSGVTANNVGTVNQTLQPKIRSPYLATLQQFYFDGSRLYSRWQSVPSTATDSDIDKLAQETNNWTINTYQWILKNITPAAAERFQQWVPSAVSFDLPGQHSRERTAAYKNACILMPQWLANLDALMRSDEMYPQ